MSSPTPRPLATSIANGVTESSPVQPQIMRNRLDLLTLPRPDFPVERLAALQRDLAPDEATRGVLRDDLERRFIGAPAVLFAALRATCDRLAPETWQLFATEWGVLWGRRAAVDLEATALEAGIVSVRDMSMRDAASRVSAYFAERGWGAVAFDFTPATEGIIVAELDRSARAEAAPRVRDVSASGGDLACHLLAGGLAGILSSLAGRKLAAREVACVAGGAPRCSIVVVAHDRCARVDAALADGQRGVEPCVSRSVVEDAPHEEDPRSGKWSRGTRGSFRAASEDAGARTRAPLGTSSTPFPGKVSHPILTNSTQPPSSDWSERRAPSLPITRL